ncbi:MAG: hypothetical protein ACKOWF_13500 [Chloroflexota bacterium]
MALSSRDAAEPVMHEPTWEDGMALLDEPCRARLGISGEEFMRQFDAGAFAGMEEDETGRAVVSLSFLPGFARPSGIDAPASDGD